ncbi:MAG: phosphotransferase [Acidobacteria bacterium]|nr:phosphotransferase [Acidobacteriota bacterium]
MTARRTSAPALSARLRERFAPVRRATAVVPDASVRAFYRLARPDGSSFVAVADPAGGPAAIARMVAARHVLAEAGARVPAIVDRDDAIPALLMEDLGQQLLYDALPRLSSAERAAAYAAAGRMAARIARHGTPLVREGHPLAEPALDARRLRRELAFFLVHDIAGRRHLDDAAFLAEFAPVLDRICSEATARQPELAHRDFHARNLMLLPGLALAAVDFQDAQLGPPYYDLASLIRDPYVEPDEALARAAARAYASECGITGDPREDPLFHWVALQRDLKAIGTYAAQARRHRRERFLAYIAPAERLALRSLDRLPPDFSKPARALFSRANFAFS